jgi:cytochrome P450
MSSTPIRYPFPWPPTAEHPPELNPLRDQPVCPVTLPSGDAAWLVTRYDDVRAVLSMPQVSRNRERPGAARMTEENTKIFQGTKVDRDPPEHTRMRRVIAKAFTATRVERLRPVVEQATEELLTELAARTPPVDLNEGFAYPLTIRVICGLLGVPESGQDVFRAGAAEAWRYVGELLEAKRERPGDDLYSALLAVRDSDDGRLSDYELHWWCTVLLLAGYETTASQLGGSVPLLLGHPEQLAKLRADPDLVPSAVEELLRCQVVGHSLSMLRYLTDDVEVGGMTLPKGSSVIPLLESANYDDTAFENPYEFDVSRPDNHHLTFSAGPHFCLGAALARLELQVALRALLLRFPTLRLAVPVEELRHKEGPLDLGYEEIPVTW